VKCRVKVCLHVDDTITVRYGPHILGRYLSNGQIITKTKIRRAA
jgi:hypothetical protein